VSEPSSANDAAWPMSQQLRLSRVWSLTRRCQFWMLKEARHSCRHLHLHRRSRLRD
jgi:hypothetical protein